MTGVVVALAAGLTPIATLGTLVSIGTLMAFVIVSIGDHRAAAHAARSAAAVPDAVVPLLPALSALVSLVLMLGLPWETWERLILWMALGDRVLLRLRLPAEPSPEQSWCSVPGATVLGA